MNEPLEGTLDAHGLKFAVLVSRFNSVVTDRLLAGAMDALLRSGCAADDLTVIRVPGAWEMPVVAAELARQKRFDAIVCLGAVVRGDTPHFDYVAGGAANGLAAVARESGVPVALGVLTTNTMEQAVDRAGGKGGNKGYDAAITAIEMANLMKRVRGV
jgi:6,7-dimethyl-8-ribityllumazine synthase